jgi:hypothetical protein
MEQKLPVLGCVTAKVQEWVGDAFVNGGVLEEHQRSYSGIWFGCHLGGYWWCTPRICKIFPLC